MSSLWKRWKTYRHPENWTLGVGQGLSLLLILAASGLLLVLLGLENLAKTIWPLWAAGTGAGLAYLAWQTDHWPDVRDASLGLEAALGGATLAVLALGVKGIVSAGLMEPTNFFLVRFGAILLVGIFVGAALYFWFYLFTTKATDRTAETMRVLSIAVLGTSLWGPYFFADVDIVLVMGHFILAIWAGVLDSGQAVAEDSVTPQTGN